MALLALLDEEPRHGYQLKTEFEGRTGSFWPLNVGQVYTTLDRLERDGLVVPVKRRNGKAQRSYAITGAGRDELHGWLAAAAPADLPRDDLLVKVLVAVGRGADEALDVIQRQRAALYGRLQAHRRADPGGDLAAALLHDAVSGRTEEDLRWLDRCEARITSQARGAPRASRQRGGNHQ